MICNYNHKILQYTIAYYNCFDQSFRLFYDFCKLFPLEIEDITTNQAVFKNTFLLLSNEMYNIASHLQYLFDWKIKFIIKNIDYNEFYATTSPSFLNTDYLIIVYLKDRTINDWNNTISLFRVFKLKPVMLCINDLNNDMLLESKKLFNNLLINPIQSFTNLNNVFEIIKKKEFICKKN